MIRKLWPALLFTAATIAALIYDGLRSVAMAGLWSYSLQQFWQGMAFITVIFLFLTPWVKRIQLVTVVALTMFAIAAINRTGTWVSLSFMGFNPWQAPELILVPFLFFVVTIVTAIGLFEREKEILVGAFVVAIGLSPVFYSEAKHIALNASNTSLQPTSALMRLLG
jgi:hypothetical protein